VKSIETPKIIHQIWVGDTAPKEIIQAMQTVRDMNPDFEYMFWGNEDIDLFNLRQEYNDSTEYSFFCNIFRVKILEKYGGIYIDADMLALVPINKWFDKYKNNRISSACNAGIFPDLGVIIAKPGIDYNLFLVDYIPNEPGGFFWQRMLPVCIPLVEIGPEGNVLKDLKLNSWVNT